MATFVKEENISHVKFFIRFLFKIKKGVILFTKYKAENKLPAR